MNEENAVFEMLRKKWQVLLTGGEELSTSSSQILIYVRSINELAGTLWDAMIKPGAGKEDTRTCLFEDLPMSHKSKETAPDGTVPNVGSSQITLTFDRLKAITLAYKTKGSDIYKNPEVKKEIIAALDIMVRDHYSLYYAGTGKGTAGAVKNSQRCFGNWYDWRIGTPRQFCDLLLMFYDELTPEQLRRYAAPILANNARVDTTGANRTWIANVFIQCGVLLGRADLIEAGKEGLKDVFQYVDKGDGFHKDGSFVQHNYFAYTGGYGKALLCTMAPIMHVLNDSPYALEYEDGREQMFFDMIFEAYEPLIYGGRFMDMAREREISREANQDNIPGRQAIRSIIMLLDVFPNNKKLRANAMVKEWISDEEVLSQVCVDPIGKFNEYYLPAKVISIAQDLIASDIEPRGSLVRHKRFSAMDRVVHLRDNFGFTISMSSDRIYNTEGTNNEGLRLWNIGDGLTYLYNSDKDYYSNHYWATVDYQRLPGITTNRVLNREPKEGYKTPNPYKYAGGTDLGEYGIAAMEMQGVGNCGRNGAHAKKSWFMFDDEIVAVGSDITSSLADSSVETIVENRKINPDKSNMLQVNGVEQKSKMADEFNGIHHDTEWIHLAGKESGSDVGYYFPGKADITGVREVRAGSWDLVNTYVKFMDTDIRTNTFVTFWFDHGITPDGAKYAYVILPGKSAEETKAYNDAPDVEILRIDEKIHAVRESKLCVTGINFFEAGEFGMFRTKQAESVMYKENEDGTIEISFADLTQASNELKLETYLEVSEVVDKDEEITVSAQNGMTVFTVSTDGKPAGKSFKLTAKMVKRTGNVLC